MRRCLTTYVPCYTTKPKPSFWTMYLTARWWFYLHLHHHHHHHRHHHHDNQQKTSPSPSSTFTLFCCHQSLNFEAQNPYLYAKLYRYTYSTLWVNKQISLYIYNYIYTHVLYIINHIHTLCISWSVWHPKKKKKTSSNGDHVFFFFTSSSSGTPEVTLETHVELRPRQRQRLGLRRRLGRRLKAPSVAAGIEEKASAVLEKRAMGPWGQASCCITPVFSWDYHGIIWDYMGLYGIIDDYSWWSTISKVTTG